MSLARRIAFGSNPRRTAVRILVLAALSSVLFGWVLLPVRTDGVSMLPSYQSGKLTFVNRLAYLRRGPSRGDVVAIRLAGPSLVYIKRIVALPGERLRIEDGLVYIDGRPLTEPYVHIRAEWNVPEVSLTADEYYVIGDNRGMRASDHDFGRVSRERILGSLLF